MTLDPLATYLTIALFAPGNMAAEPARIPPVDKLTAEACQAAADVVQGMIWRGFRVEATCVVDPTPMMPRPPMERTKR